MAVVSPPSVSALPTPPSTASPSTFDSRADAFLGALPTFQTENNAVAANVFANATDAATSATTSAAAAAAAAAATGAPIWVAGSYVTGSPTYSPINGMVYRRLTPGGATTLDPSTDPTNWAVVAGGDVTQTGVQTLTNKTLTNPTITNLTETVHAPAAGSAFTVDWANGTIQKYTTNANVTITLPAAATGKGGTLIIAYGGTHTVTFAGGTSIKYPAGTAPAATSVNGKKDVYAIVCHDATETLVQDGGRNF